MKAGSVTFGYSLSLEAVAMRQVRRWKRLWQRSLMCLHKRTSMGPSRRCWNGTSALQPEEITSKGTRVSCVYYQNTLETYLMILISFRRFSSGNLSDIKNIVFYNFRWGFCLQYKYNKKTISDFPVCRYRSYLFLVFYFYYFLKGKGKSFIDERKLLGPKFQWFQNWLLKIKNKTRKDNSCSWMLENQWLLPHSIYIVNRTPMLYNKYLYICLKIRSLKFDLYKSIYAKLFSLVKFFMHPADKIKLEPFLCWKKNNNWVTVFIEYLHF